MRVRANSNLRHWDTYWQKKWEEERKMEKDKEKVLTVRRGYDIIRVR